MMAEAKDLLVYLLPTLGSMLLFYGIFQVIAESQSSVRRKMQSRLHGERKQEADKMVASILRRGAGAHTKTIADKLIGKFKFMPRIQTLLDQADIDWSATQMMLNLCGISAVVAAGMLMLKISMFVAGGCAGGAISLPLMWVCFTRTRRVEKLAAQFRYGL